MRINRRIKISRNKVLCLVFLVALALGTVSTSCSTSLAANDEILIALKTEAINLLNKPEEPDTLDTGIPSLDILNRKWNVTRMVRVFPEISPDDEVAARYGLAGIFKLLVPRSADLAEMIRDYEADPHIDYAELNQPYEIK